MVSQQQSVLQTAFTKNRTEELGHDVWENFVVPPFYDQLDLREARKPRIIVGGRGCGKTMLLRYLSHQTAFSPKRANVPPNSTQHIGVYWRADTQFSRLMSGRGLSDELWISAFNHLIGVVAGLEVLSSLRSMANSRIDGMRLQDLERLDFSELSAYDRELGGSLRGMQEAMRRKLFQLEEWVTNAARLQEPQFLPGPAFLRSLIDLCQSQVAPLRNSTYFVYLDEYENLQPLQQRVINTCLKHSESPLIFNLAMKRNGLVTEGTLGEEAIVDIADYRTYDLEAYLKKDFALFAAEVLFLTLNAAGWSGPVDPAMLRDPARLGERRQPGYRDEVLRMARELFPGLSHEQLAQTVFESPALTRRLERRIEQTLKQRGSSLPVSAFLRPQLAQASVTASALVARPRLDPDVVLTELNRLGRGEPNDFSGSRAWVHNNFIGCLLALYESHGSTCPFYAGFDTFCSLSQQNLRHFLELCHKSMNGALTSFVPGQEPALAVEAEQVYAVPVNAQAEAARQASTAFLSQIRSFGRLGNRLHAFVLRLGALFHLAHQRATQSEPEQCHFAIVGGDRPLTDTEVEFLLEAEKWSVLTREESTKIKDPVVRTMDFEYVLNPIYAPYFNISYRKRHRLELRSEEFGTLVGGGFDAYNGLLKSYSRKWSVTLDEAGPSLFAQIWAEAE